ncbi:MAG: glycosyltransferase family 39 protein [candidate division Zixibacteria bacterium]|nr:glycosyltransferase family 39 protein [candidate division Zixibacteria bacterium]
MLAKFARLHPLLMVLVVALGLRLPAVVFSRGYMASDDHYETVNVAYNWLTEGMYSDDGNLRWRHHVDRDVARNPLYTLALLGIMKGYQAAGIMSLDTMMYGLRLLHALLSLATVWMVFAAVRLITRSDRWAVAAGLILAAQALMPFLSVRNLIEMVSAPFLAAAVYFLYSYQSDGRQRALVWAGVLTGLAWMIRFPVALAALPVPVVLVWETRSLRPAMHYALGVSLVLLASGLLDWMVIGSFAASTVNLFADFLEGGEAMYNTILLVYPVVILGFFVPPFSLVAAALCFSREMWRNHRLLITSILSFVVMHTLLANRQERFMIPIIPLVAILFITALWQHFRNGGVLARRPRLFKAIVGVSVALNVLLLIPFTVNYGHKGLVEPLVKLDGCLPRPRVLMVSPDHAQIYPGQYAGYPLIYPAMANSWSDFAAAGAEADPPDLVFLYPPDSALLPAYLDSVRVTWGEADLMFRVGPSTIDYVLHVLNPKYNPTHEMWAYRLGEKGAVDGANDSAPL